MQFLRSTKLVIVLLALIVLVLSARNYKISRKNLSLRSEITQLKKDLFGKFDGVLVKDTNFKDNSFDLLLMGNDFVSSMIYYNNTWEPHLQNALHQLVKPGNKALVLGSHIGYHALLISKLVGDAGKVSIFEANPHTLKFLRANLAFNDIKNATIFPKAAFSSNRSLQFVALTSGNTGGSHIQRKGDDNSNSNLITVDAVSIDSIKEIDTIDILQMDIESSEAQAVFGAKELIDNSPHLIVFQEWSPTWMKDDVDAYLEFWRSRGYKIAEITTTGLIELTDEQLKNISFADIILAKNLDQIISNFKPCK